MADLTKLFRSKVDPLLVVSLHTMCIARPESSCSLSDVLRLSTQVSREPDLQRKWSSGSPSVGIGATAFRVSIKRSEHESQLRTEQAPGTHLSCERDNGQELVARGRLASRKF